jgi:hypothetical protein
LLPPVPCSAPGLSTAGWRTVTALRGRFEILLPQIAYEPLADCIDSACGHIKVGDWTIDYDGGEMAGPGFPREGRPTLQDSRPRERLSRCEEEINGRPVLIETFRIPLKRGDYHASERGLWVAAATTRYRLHSGLYLRVTGRSPRDLQEFLVAVRTLRMPAER